MSETVGLLALGLPPGAGSSPGPFFEVVHSIPGRVRLQFPRASKQAAEKFAGSVSAHAQVRSVRWNAGCNSLIVNLHPGADWKRIVETLPRSGAPLSDEERRGPTKDVVAPVAAALGGLLVGGGAGGLVVMGCALPVAARAWRGLRQRRLAVDLLDALAVGAMLATGQVGAAGASVGLIEGSEAIRNRAAGRARRAMRGWMALKPKGVRVVRDGAESRVPMGTVRVGDRIVLYMGESVPVDGRVTAGSGLLDASTWTGEAAPVALGPGATVLAGTTLTNGRVVVRVTALGDETRAGILAMALETALAADTRASDLALRAADRMVVPVLSAAGLALGLARDASRAISVLVFDYGTGFRVGIPTAVLSGMYIGIRHNVLFKSGRGLEALGGADTIVFDKTGTLTSGELSLVRVTSLNHLASEVSLAMAAAAEGHLSHPIARAIQAEARRRGLPLQHPDQVDYHPSGGIDAAVQGHRVLIGSRRFLTAIGIPVPALPDRDAQSVWLAVDGVCTARMDFRDVIRDTAARAVGALRDAGVRTLWLASGDQDVAAAAVARRLSLDGHTARLMPEQKVELVHRMQAEGRRVAYVGDGINDALAMAAADVGIAILRGAEMARESAEVILLTEDLAALVMAVKLARETMGTVRQQIPLVVVPNTLGIAVALLRPMSPMVATLLNNGSTALVGLNGLRPLLAERSGDRRATRRS